ncbi:MAG: GNAT family N-acetyltransferase [Candidatus Krumholzibacteriia bacterium]
MKASRNGLDVVRAGVEHLDQVSGLFDQYRAFYRRASDADGVKGFIEERLRAKDSVIYLALGRPENTPLGFTQLYPSFSSVSMKPLWILNDLYVATRGRRQGIARALIDRARRLAVDTGAKGLILETAIDNTPAQTLYERYGFVRDTEFYRYALDL